MRKHGFKLTKNMIFFWIFNAPQYWLGLMMCFGRSVALNNLIHFHQQSIPALDMPMGNRAQSHELEHQANSSVATRNQATPDVPFRCAFSTRNDHHAHGRPSHIDRTQHHPDAQQLTMAQTQLVEPGPSQTNGTLARCRSNCQPISSPNIQWRPTLKLESTEGRTETNMNPRSTLFEEGGGKLEQELVSTLL
jgi:hypothetical protein